MKKLVGLVSILISVGIIWFITRPDLHKTETRNVPKVRSFRSPHPGFQLFSFDETEEAITGDDPNIEDPTVEKAERVNPTEEDQSSEGSRNGYSEHLFDETRRQLTQEWGKVPTDREVIAHLDGINGQIHEANEELSENVSLMKNYYEEGNLEAIKELQAMIFAKHVKRLPAMEVYSEDDYPRSFGPKEKVQLINEQFERYLETLVPPQ